MAVDNSTILDNVWLHATNDYQQRIPNSTQASVAQTMKALFDPMNGRYLNMFQDALINRIGMTVVNQQNWDNPLAPFNKGALAYGSTVQELGVKWIKSHHYKDDDEAVYKMHRPEAAQWFHSLNRQEYYPITIVEEELAQAFVDDSGLNKYVSSLLTAPVNSDQYDTYRATLQLIATYEQSFGFFKKQVSRVDSKAAGEDFLVQVREDATTLTFPSQRYNAGAIDIPVFAPKKELVLITLPRVKANTDVRNLAAAFNRSDAEIQTRVIEVDEFPVAGCEAILTTEDFFQIWDKLYRTTSQYNPLTLGTNYFLHHWQILSVSPFVPAIMYTTDAGTTTPTITQTVTGLNLTASAATAAAGSTVPLTVQLTGSLAGDPAGTDTSAFYVAPDAATFEISAVDGSSNPVKTYATTYVDDEFVLHLSKKLAAGTVVTVTATSTYTNPGGDTTAYTDTASVTIA